MPAMFRNEIPVRSGPFPDYVRHSEFPEALWNSRAYQEVDDQDGVRLLSRRGNLWVIIAADMGEYIFALAERTVLLCGNAVGDRSSPELIGIRPQRLHDAPVAFHVLANFTFSMVTDSIAGSVPFFSQLTSAEGDL
jgi:hypothetical protein